MHSPPCDELLSTNEKFEYFMERTEKDFESLEKKFERFDQKLDLLMSFRWMIIGMSLVLSTMASILVTYLSNYLNR